MRPRRVLVTCGEQRSSLAVVRSLGRAGHRVEVVSERDRSLAGASRHAAASHRVPSPLGRPTEFVAAIDRLLQSREIDVLLPVTDAALLALLPERSRWPSVLVPFAGSEAYRSVSDKARVTCVARELGLAVPEGHRLESAADLRGLDAGELGYPVVLKPSRSVAASRDGGRRRKLGVLYARDARELEDLARGLPPEAYPVLLQRHIPGSGVGVFVLLRDGEVRAAFAHRRIREKPPTGGVSVYRESVSLDPVLLDRSVALLDAFDWEGVAMVEYRVESGTGTPYVMEVNGRFWGSLQLAVDAGVDFPRLLLEAASEDRGTRPAGGRGSPPSYRVGVRSRWWWGEVDHFLARLREDPDDGGPPLDPALGGRLRAFFSLVRPWRSGDRSEILRLSDPRPFVRETRDWLAGR